MDIKAPIYAVNVLNELLNGGYEAYFVGGCVRDSLLGLPVNDWDICTSALPEQTIAAMSGCRVVETGLKHGTVTVITDGGAVEVTTFRVDGSYSDCRRPDSVSFTRSLREDLARRDFTMNAVAYNDKDGLVDPFGGEEDIRTGVIRAVGDPEKRFSEDALRILRAVRFCSKLSMDIEPATADAMHRLRTMVRSVSSERVFSELNKLLMGDNVCFALTEFSDVITEIIPELSPSVGFLQHSRHHDFDVYKHTAFVVDRSEKDPIVRLAALFHDISKPGCFTLDEDGSGHFYGHAEKSAEIARSVLRRLHCDSETADTVALLIKYHCDEFYTGERHVKRLLNRLGYDNLCRLAALRRADTRGKLRCGVEDENRLLAADRLVAVADEIISREECFSLKDLAINGNDLIEHGLKEGAEIGKCLNKVLTAVIDGEIENNKYECLCYLDLDL